MGRILGSLLIFVFIIAALLGVLILGLPLIPLERLAPQIETRASAFLGRDVEINGALRLSAIPSPRIKIQDVSMANWANGATANPIMASVDEVDLVVQLAPLFSRQIKVDKLVVRRPQILLEQNQDGANWQFDIATASDQGPQPAPQTTTDSEGTNGFSLEDISLNGIEILDASASITLPDGQTYALSDLRLAAQMRGLDQPLTAEIAATWQENSLGFTGVLATARDLMVGNAFNIDGQVRLNDHQANANGVVSLTPAISLSGLQLSANGPSVAQLLAVFDINAPINASVLSAYDISGTVDYAGQQVNLNDFSAQVGDVQLSGDILASFFGGFFAQSSSPIRLSIGNVNQWVQALPNPPLPSNPGVLSALDFSGFLAVSPGSVDMFDAALTLNDFSAQGGASVALVDDSSAFRLETAGPVSARVGNLNQWLQLLAIDAIPNAPALFTELSVSGEIDATANSIQLNDANLSLSDLLFQGGADVQFTGDNRIFTLATDGPVSARIGNLNQWLQILGIDAIHNRPDLFGALDVSGQIAATSQTIQLVDTRLSLSDINFQGGMLAQLSAGDLQYQSLGDVQVAIGSADRWLDLIPNRPIPQSPQLFGPVRLSGQISGSLENVDLQNAQFALGDINGAGSFSARFGAGGVQAQSRGPLRVSGPSVDLIATTFGVTLPRVDPNAYGNFAAQTEFSFDGQRLALNSLDAQMDDTRIQGRVALDLSTQPLTFDVNLAAGGIDIRPYIELTKRDPVQRKAVAIKDPAAPWGNVPLSFAFLNTAQGQAVVRLDSVTTGLVDLGQTVAQLNWRGGALAANFQGTELYEGQASGQVGLTNQNGVSGMAADVNLSGVDAGRVLADLLGVDQMQGVSTLNLEVGTQGLVLQDWMSSLNGRFTAQVDPLAFLGLDVLGSLENLQGGAFSAIQGADARTDLRSVGLSGDIVNGEATIDDLSADIGSFDVSGLGKINIGMQRLDYKLEILYNNQVPIPFIISGPWTKPAVRIDSTRVLEFALDNPQLFLDMLPAEWNLQGLLPEGASLLNIEQQAQDLLAQEQARLQALAQQEANRLAAQAQAEAQRLAQQAAIAAQAEADRIAQQLADEAAAFARAQAQQLANQIGDQAGQAVQGAVNQGIQQLGQSQLGQQLQQQAQQAAGDALGNFLGGILGN